MIDRDAKEKLIKEFRMMQEFEASARDYYLKAAGDPVVCGGEIGAEFGRIASQEESHIKIVGKIIALIKENL